MLEHLFATVPHVTARRKLLSTLRVANSATYGAHGARTDGRQQNRNSYLTAVPHDAHSLKEGTVQELSHLSCAAPFNH